MIGITGSSGFLGKHIVKELKEKKLEVIEFARSVLNNERYYDLENGGEIDLTGITTLIHCAAYLPNNDNINETEKCLKLNAVATQQLLEATKQSNISHFVYISSGGVYGWDNELATEQDNTNPIYRAVPYLSSKLMGELTTQYYSKYFKTTIIRSSTIFGNGMKKSGFLFKLIKKIKENSLTTEDVGCYPIDLVAVSDLVSFIINIITNQRVGIFNVGGGEQLETPDIVEMIAKIENKQMDIEYEKPQIGHPWLNISKAKYYGYQPKTKEKLNIFIENYN